MIAWLRPSDTGAALAAAAVCLPGLLLNAQQSIDSAIPWRSFMAAGLAPLALAPMLLPGFARQTRLRRWIPALVLPLIPAIWGVIRAAQAEALSF